ncbi:MAG: glycosyl transferase family 4, partial [Chloroflexi bacterium]|nr:glycosyl transferase family 4 [Chloroflexota bacterium]
MTVYLLSFVLAMAAALAATPVARRAAIRLDIVDHPGGRKAHLSPVPYLGGVAIYLAFILILVVAVAPLEHNSGFAKATGQLVAVVGGASLMALLGLADDRYNLPPLLKLLGQLAGAGILVAAQVTIHFNHQVFAPLQIPITVLWIVGVTNAFNLMDNMDGLAVGTAGIAACFFFLHAILALPVQSFVALLTAALAGACFGFLYYNWSPAKIFMGDAGSLFLGYLLAALALKLSLTTASPELQQLAVRAGYSTGVTQNLHAVALLAPIFVLGIPLFDTSLVTISRLRRGVPVSQGGRDHLSHRLVGAGLSHREAVMSLYLASCALGAISIMLTRANLAEGASITVIMLLIGVGFFMYFERL